MVPDCLKLRMLCASPRVEVASRRVRFSRFAAPAIAIAIDIEREMKASCFFDDDG